MNLLLGSTGAPERGTMDRVTAPGPHSPPTSRRAARSQRERDDERAREPLNATVPLPVIDPLAPIVGAHVPQPVASTAEAPAEAPAEDPPVYAPYSRRSAQTLAAQSVAAPRPDTAPRHARARRAARVGAVFALAAAASLVMGSAAALTAAVGGPVVTDSAAVLVGELPEAKQKADERIDAPDIEAETGGRSAMPLPAPAATIPAPTIETAPAVLDICADPAVPSAIAAGDDAGAIAAAGGAEAFRAAIAAGIAACVPLDDPAHVWVVVNKLRPYTPIDYSPSPLSTPQGVRSAEGYTLRTDAAEAMSAMVAAAAQAGAGEIGLGSGFRSYETQATTFGSQADAAGVEAAELSSARPGFSEHQSGLAADVVPCGAAVGDGCGTLDDLASTPQGEWIVAHAWEFGWITRYVDGATPVSGYVPEPWHLRYVGPELAKAYHDGAWSTLEQFFGLPAAPDYAE